MEKIKYTDTIYVTGILWNMGEKYLREMMIKVAIMEDVVQLRLMDLGNEYEKFVYDCYSSDEEALEDGYIYEKIKAMNTDCKKIVAFSIKIDDPHYIINSEGKKQCIEARKIKQKIRDEYSKKIDGYFFDNLIHMADNVEEIESTEKVINDYKKYTIADYIRKGYEGTFKKANVNIKEEQNYIKILKKIDNNEKER